MAWDSLCPCPCRSSQWLAWNVHCAVRVSAGAGRRLLTTPSCGIGFVAKRVAAVLLRTCFGVYIIMVICIPIFPFSLTCQRWRTGKSSAVMLCKHAYWVYRTHLFYAVCMYAQSYHIRTCTYSTYVRMCCYILQLCMSVRVYVSDVHNVSTSPVSCMYVCSLTDENLMKLIGRCRPFLGHLNLRGCVFLTPQSFSVIGNHHWYACCCLYIL